MIQTLIVIDLDTYSDWKRIVLLIIYFAPFEKNCRLFISLFFSNESYWKVMKIEMNHIIIQHWLWYIFKLYFIVWICKCISLRNIDLWKVLNIFFNFIRITTVLKMHESKGGPVETFQVWLLKFYSVFLLEIMNDAIGNVRFLFFICVLPFYSFDLPSAIVLNLLFILHP